MPFVRVSRDRGAGYGYDGFVAVGPTHESLPGSRARSVIASGTPAEPVIGIKKAWPHGTAMTRHREEPPGVCEGRRRGDLRLGS
ncbi:MAG TPA: hypothetical protein PLY86_04085 [bacterium]|nr:hypothetical protein [bacterium]